MTVTQAVLGFAVVAGLLTIIPGLDTALVLRSAISRGRGYAFAAAAGINAAPAGSARWPARDSVARITDRITGTVLIAFGAKLALDS